jgi:hypothetical protein
MYRINLTENFFGILVLVVYKPSGKPDEQMWNIHTFHPFAARIFIEQVIGGVALRHRCKWQQKEQKDNKLFHMIDS